MAAHLLRRRLRWIGRPAVHFVLIGAFLYAGGQWFAPRGAIRPAVIVAGAPAAMAGAYSSATLPAPRQERPAIVFNVDRVAQLAGDFTVRYGRAPSRAEL